jgi:Ni/Fe-hydrogenase subunit HybB-like protein
MSPHMVEKLRELLPQVTGYIYPNEIEVHWGLLIVVYPYITGIVAGAFILASLVKVFNVKEVQPLYRLALLTALAFLLVAPLSLVSHLGHPFRAYEIFLTPQTSSAMAMFGFVYAWYLMVVLLVEIWFDYRKDMIVWAHRRSSSTGTSASSSGRSRRTRGGARSSCRSSSCSPRSSPGSRW